MFINNTELLREAHSEPYKSGIYEDLTLCVCRYKIVGIQTQTTYIRLPLPSPHR